MLPVLTGRVGAAVSAVTIQLYHWTGHRKTVLPGTVFKPADQNGVLELDGGTAALADQIGAVVVMADVRARQIGVRGFQAMDEALCQQKIQCSIHRGRRQTAPQFGLERGHQVISTARTRLTQHQTEQLPAGGRETHAPLDTQGFGLVQGVPRVRGCVRRHVVTMVLQSRPRAARRRPPEAPP